VPIHQQSYGLAAYDDPAYLSGVVRADIPRMAPYLPAPSNPAQPLAGLAVCHLQCHIGTDTLSLARAGAQVTGVDFSLSALQSAAKLTAKYGVPASWVETDVLDARAAVTKAALAAGNSEPPLFDLVYTSVGTTEWLPDLAKWAAQIAALLRPGGLFYIHDSHPFMYVFDDDDTDNLIAVYPYFPDGTAMVDDEEYSYSGDQKLQNTRNYTWQHSISEIINALLDAGLVLLRMEEGTTIPWQYSEMMVEDGDDNYAWPEPLRNGVPVSYTLIARKPLGNPVLA